MTDTAWSPVKDGFASKTPIEISDGVVVVAVQALWTEEDGVAATITTHDDEAIPAKLFPALGDIFRGLEATEPPGVTEGS